MKAAPRSRKRTDYVNAEESRIEKTYKWVARLWPVIIGLGILLWSATAEWRDYTTIKETVGHTEPTPTGLVKKVGELDGKLEKLGEGQKETHGLVRDLANKISGARR